MRKIIILTLCFVLILPLLTGCAHNTDGDTLTTAVTDTGLESLTSDTTTAETEFMEDDLGTEINFGGKSIIILYWSDVQNHEFEIQEISGDLIDDAIYKRNQRVEERLGVELAWAGTKGNYGNQADFVSAAQNDVLAGGTSYDIFAGYSMTAATLALKGCTQNLLALDYLNFEKTWWPASLIEQSTISERLYFCSGDISCNLLYMMYTVYFNKDLITKYNLENPYDIVNDNRWTVDKMIEMSTGIYSDLNGNSVSDAGDSFGFVTYDIFYDSFFWGSGLTEIEKDTSGNLVVSDNWNSEKTLSLLNKLCPFFNESGYTYTSTNSTDLYTCFSQGNALFALTEAQYSIRWFSSSDVSYGVIPVPKYDSSQDKFVTILSFPYTMYSISLATKNSNEAAAVLECYASESYRNVTPAVFETSFKYKYSSGNEDVVMWDIIRSTVSFELGRIFSTSLQNLSYSIFRNAVKNNTASSWTSQFKTYSKVINKCISDIQNTISSLQ